MHDESMPLLHAAIYPRQAQQRTVVQDRARALPARAETIREGLGGDLRPSPDPLGPPDPHPRPEVLPQRGEGAAVPRKRETRRGGAHRAPSSRLGVGGLFVWLAFGFKLLDSRRHRRRRRRRRRRYLAVVRRCLQTLSTHLIADTYPTPHRVASTFLSTPLPLGRSSRTTMTTKREKTTTTTKKKKKKMERQRQNKSTKATTNTKQRPGVVTPLVVEGRRRPRRQRGRHHTHAATPSHSSTRPSRSPARNPNSIRRSLSRCRRRRPPFHKVAVVDTIR